MSDQYRTGIILLVSLCCVWPLVAYFILNRLGRIWRGLGAMLDRILHWSSYR